MTRNAEHPRADGMLRMELFSALKSPTNRLVGAILDIGVVLSSPQDARHQSLNGGAAVGDEIHRVSVKSGGNSAGGWAGKEKHLGFLSSSSPEPGELFRIREGISSSGSGCTAKPRDGPMGPRNYFSEP
jgi:hypothetical protein